MRLDIAVSSNGGRTSYERSWRFRCSVDTRSITDRGAKGWVRVADRRGGVRSLWSAALGSLKASPELLEWSLSGVSLRDVVSEPAWVRGAQWSCGN